MTIFDGRSILYVNYYILANYKQHTMDQLKRITIRSIQYADQTDTIETYNGSNTWYTIMGWINDPSQALQRQVNINKLVEYFPQSIDEENLPAIMHESPIHTENRMKSFVAAENTRLSTKQRVGNAKCKKCNGEAIKSGQQTKSGDEATTVFTECLDAGCGYIKKE